MVRSVVRRRTPSQQPLMLRGGTQGCCLRRGGGLDARLPAGRCRAMVLHILPRRLMAIGIAAGLIEVIAAALVGAWLYKEESVSR